MSETVTDPTHWNAIAEIRRQQIESGKDLTFTKIFVPYFEQIVRARGARRLIEIGCGTGHMLLALHKLVQHALGVDSSPGMLSIARETLRCTNVTLTAGPIADLEGKGNSDLIISNLTLQTVEDLFPLLLTVRSLIADDGRFVFSIPHPCFWNIYQKFIPEDEYNYVKVTRVNAELSVRGEKVGRVPYVHRPLREYFQVLCEAELSVAFLDEIIPDPEIEALYGERWKNPRYAVFHCMGV